jgi:hypothetical protein
VKITNNFDINLPLAVWLLHDEYDHQDIPNYISATSLMKPIKQSILVSRIPMEEREADVSEYIARAHGHSIHDSIEKAWIRGKDRTMRLLGYPQEIIERVVVNPTEEQLRSRNDIIPVYLEQRAFKQVEVDGITFTVGGKFDMVADGVPFDHKASSVYSFIKGSKDEDYILQPSIYRWLNPDKITADHGTINFIFTDWSKMMSRTANYPQKRVESKTFPLLSVTEVDAWVKNRIQQIHRLRNAPESQIPECNDKELWRSEPVWKYYSNPAKTDGRATKNFDNKADAHAHMASQGKGVIKEVPGEPKACGYCPAYAACTQKDRYFAS